MGISHCTAKQTPKPRFLVSRSLTMYTLTLHVIRTKHIQDISFSIQKFLEVTRTTSDIIISENKINVDILKRKRGKNSGKLLRIVHCTTCIALLNFRLFACETTAAVCIPRIFRSNIRKKILH